MFRRIIRTNAASHAGFTLIELLVVIAIIGILASVVLASLNSARTRGANAAIKAELKNLQLQSEMYYSTHGAYSDGGGTGVCNNDDVIQRIMASIDEKSPGSTVCRYASQQYGFSAQLAQPEGSFTHWCVDWRGSSVGRTSDLPSGVRNCD